MVKKKKSNKLSPCKRRSNTHHLDTPTLLPGACRRGRTGKCITTGATAQPQRVHGRACTCLAVAGAAILRLTGDENAQILTASPHDAPPRSTRRCCQSERRRQRRRELVMFSLYCLFLFFGAVYWIPPEFITASLPSSCL